MAPRPLTSSVMRSQTLMPLQTPHQRVLFCLLHVQHPTVHKRGPKLKRCSLLQPHPLQDTSSHPTDLLTRATTLVKHLSLSLWTQVKQERPTTRTFLFFFRCPHRVCDCWSGRADLLDLQALCSSAHTWAFRTAKYVSKLTIEKSAKV